MNLHRLLLERDAAANPVRVALIGAGKFGTMYLSQAGRTPGIRIAALVDLDPARAKAACERVGLGDTFITDDAMAVIAGDDL